MKAHITKDEAYGFLEEYGFDYEGPNLWSYSVYDRYEDDVGYADGEEVIDAVEEMIRMSIVAADDGDTIERYRCLVEAASHFGTEQQLAWAEEALDISEHHGFIGMSPIHDEGDEA